MKDRFMYWSPFGVTDPWKPSIFLGGDEWHNKSIAVKLPFLGCFIFFYEKDFSRKGEEHVHSFNGSEGYTGEIHENCDGCMVFVGLVEYNKMPRPA